MVSRPAFLDNYRYIMYIVLYKFCTKEIKPAWSVAQWLSHLSCESEIKIQSPALPSLFCRGYLHILVIQALDFDFIVPLSYSCQILSHFQCHIQYSQVDPNQPAGNPNGIGIQVQVYNV